MHEGDDSNSVQETVLCLFDSEREFGYHWHVAICVVELLEPIAEQYEVTAFFECYISDVLLKLFDMFG